MAIVIPLIVILFVHRICTGASDILPTNISEGYYGSSGDMLETIMSLHLDYCGYFPSCSSGFAFTEPEEKTPVYPVPCCPPCSCLPTCTNHGNCCPDFEVGLQLNSSTVHDIEMSFQMLAARSENDNQTQGFSEQTMDTENHLHTKFNVERMDMQENSNRSNSTDYSRRGTGSKTAIHTYQTTVDVRTTCVRPQVLVDINRVPDAYAYKMVTSCLNGYGNTSINAQAMKSSKEMCANGLKNSNLSDIVPVTSLLTLRTYINIHCLVCNEGKHDGDDAVQPWRIVLVEGLVALVDAFYENQQAVLDSLTIFTRKRNIHFVPESQVKQYLEPCQAIDVDSCNVTGIWDVHNIHITSVCESGHQLPVVETFADKNIVFKNVGCVQCNRGRDNPYTHRRCSLEEGSESLGIPRLDINHNIDKDDKLIRWMEDLAVIFNETVAVKKKCADGYYHIKGRCREVLCPRDHYKRNGDCFPLYNKLEGLGTHFMISIKTSRQIKRTETEEFILKLQKVLAASINLTITIPICKTSLWFLPRLQSKPSTVYYIFSVYLEKTSESVYGEIIQQVSYFWITLTSQTKMTLTNSPNVELSFDFGHQVTAMKKRVMDIATGRFLRVLVGGQLGGAKCGASKVVNERNWCYQTFLNMSEVKTITRDYIVMNGTGKVLYSSQYDILVKNTSMIIVTCIRELDEQNDGDMVTDNVPTIAQDVTLVTETSVAILICFTLVVVVVVLHAIFRRYIKRREDST